MLPPDSLTAHNFIFVYLKSLLIYNHPFNLQEHARTERPHLIVATMDHQVLTAVTTDQIVPTAVTMAHIAHSVVPMVLIEKDVVLKRNHDVRMENLLRIAAKMAQ
jgi:hypothetical protein